MLRVAASVELESRQARDNRTVLLTAAVGIVALIFNLIREDTDRGHVAGVVREDDQRGWAEVAAVAAHPSPARRSCDRVPGGEEAAGRGSAAARRGVGRHRLCRVDREGNPPTPNTLTYWWKRSVQLAGVRSIRLHDVRHTRGTLMHLRDVPIAVIAAWLGHASAAFTQSTYTHSQDPVLLAAASLSPVVTIRDESRKEAPETKPTASDLCPQSDSNRHCADFKSAASANWAIGATGRRGCCSVTVRRSP